MGTGQAVLKSDWWRAGLRMDLLVFVYSYMKTGCQFDAVHVRILWKTRGEERKYTEDDILWDSHKNIQKIFGNAQKSFLENFRKSRKLPENSEKCL